MKKMVADRKFTYKSRDVQAGDEFEADDNDVHVLSVVGHAHAKPQDEAPRGEKISRRGQKYATRVMRASRA